MLAARRTGSLRPFAASALGCGVLAVAVVLLAGSPHPAPPPGTRLFTDRAVGFALSYPTSWTALRASDPQVALLATDRSRSLALLVRATPLGIHVRDVTLADLPDLRPLTDRLIRADRRAHQLEEPAEVEIHGLAGFAYVSTERPAPTTPPVAHIHYFLFDGPTLIALVFQIEHPARLRAVAPALARIAATLHPTGAQ